MSFSSCLHLLALDSLASWLFLKLASMLLPQDLCVCYTLCRNDLPLYTQGSLSFSIFLSIATLVSPLSDGLPSNVSVFPHPDISLSFFQSLVLPIIKMYSTVYLQYLLFSSFPRRQAQGSSIAWKSAWNMINQYIVNQPMNQWMNWISSFSFLYLAIVVYQAINDKGN